jgi:hypothetical protein
MPLSPGRAPPPSRRRGPPARRASRGPSRRPRGRDPRGTSQRAKYSIPHDRRRPTSPPDAAPRLRNGPHAEAQHGLHVAQKLPVARGDEHLAVRLGQEASTRCTRGSAARAARSAREEQVALVVARREDARVVDVVAVGVGALGDGLHHDGPRPRRSARRSRRSARGPPTRGLRCRRSQRRSRAGRGCRRRATPHGWPSSRCPPRAPARRRGRTPRRGRPRRRRGAGPRRGACGRARGRSRRGPPGAKGARSAARGSGASCGLWCMVEGHSTAPGPAPHAPSATPGWLAWRLRRRPSGA